MGLIDKAKDLAADHPEHTDKIVEKGGDAVDAKTGDKYVEKVDIAQDKVTQNLDGK